MGLYVGNTKYKVMSGNNKASLFPVYPYDSEVEYLESTGTQYIDTDVTPNQELSIEIKWKNKTTQSGKYLFGSGSSTTNCIRGYISTNGYWRFGGGYGALNTTDTTLRTAVMDKEGLVINGVTYNYNGTVGTFSSARTIKIFAGDSGNAPISTCIYYFKISNNGTLVRDLIPVRVGTTGYMYDRVSGKLFSNSGTGSFVLGPDKPIYDAEVEYLESTGTQYINTGIVVTSTDNMFIDFQKTTSYSYQAFYAGRRTNENNATSYSLGQINGKFDGRLGSGNLGYGTSINLNRHTLELDPVNGNVIQDSSTTASCGTFASSNLPVYLFGVNTNGAAGYSQYPIRVFEFSISDKIHLIPVRVGSVGYMYDTISHKLFGNAGTGSFIVGNDKN